MFRERTQQIHQHHKRASTAAEERKYSRLLSALWDKYQNEEQQQVICMFPLFDTAPRNLGNGGVVLERGALNLMSR